MSSADILLQLGKYATAMFIVLAAIVGYVKGRQKKPLVPVNRFTVTWTFLTLLSVLYLLPGILSGSRTVPGWLLILAVLSAVVFTIGLGTYLVGRSGARSQRVDDYLAKEMKESPDSDDGMREKT